MHRSEQAFSLGGAAKRNRKAMVPAFGNMNVNDPVGPSEPYSQSVGKCAQRLYNLCDCRVIFFFFALLLEAKHTRFAIPLQAPLFSQSITVPFTSYQRWICCSRASRRRHP